MSIVVSQTQPFSDADLDLARTTRWSTLLPLVRPNLQVVHSNDGHQVIIDGSLIKNRRVHIVVVANDGSVLRGPVLERDTLTAVVLGDSKTTNTLKADDISEALASAGVDVTSGLVLIRPRDGAEIQVLMHDSTVEVTTGGQLMTDHVVRLLTTSSESCRRSIQDTNALLQSFARTNISVQSRFSTQTDGTHATLTHSSGSSTSFEKAKHAIEEILHELTSNHAPPDQTSVYSVHYADINGLSRLESYIIAGEIAAYLTSRKIAYRLSQSTIIDHNDTSRGLAVSIVPVQSHVLTPQAVPSSGSLDEAGTKAVMPNALSGHTQESAPKFTDADIRQRIISGCNAVIAAEPTITGYDTIVGDGDCGFTLRDGAKQVLSYIASRDLMHFSSVLSGLVAELEVNMGGTSGALYCIFLTALSFSLAVEPTVPAAAKGALDTLCKYTKARVGDRTMMDVLIPFVDSLASTGGNVQTALQEARHGLDGTKTMEAKLGRSTYLDESATKGVPDPGAYGLLVLLEGLCQGKGACSKADSPLRH